MAKIRQDFLIAEIRGFLEHQLVIQEDGVIYHQDDLPNRLVLVLNAKPVFAMTGSRYHSKVPELQNEISRHGIFPFWEGPR
jgi:hypothetical protein